MQEKAYGPAVDMWSVGCIVGEILLGSPLFQSDSEWAALTDICKLAGTPQQDEWPEFWTRIKDVFKIDKFPKYQSQWRNKFPPPSRSFVRKHQHKHRQRLTFDARTLRP